MEESIDTEIITSEQLEPEDGNEMVNSAERIVITKGEPKILSRYLSARIASCHDSCKYGGIHHPAEAKPWIVARKMAITKDKKIKVTREIVISVPGMKKSTSSSNPSPASKFGDPNSFVVIKDQSSMDGTVPSEKNLPPSEETDVPIDHALCDSKKEKSEQPSLPVQEYSSNQTSREVVKMKGPFGSGSKKTSERRSKQRRASLIGDKKVSVSPSSSKSSKQQYVKKSSSIISKTAKNLKGVSNLKDQKDVIEVKAEPNSNDNLPEKILEVDEPTLASDPAKLSLVSPSYEDTSLKQDNGQISKSGSPASSKKSFRQAGHGFHAAKSQASSPLSSGMKGKRRIQNKDIASSSLSPLSQSASSKRIPKHADHGINPSKSLSPTPLSSEVIIKRRMQNTVPNDSSSSGPLPKLASSRRAFRHADHRIRPTKSLGPSPLSSGIEHKRHLQHTMHSASSSSSSSSSSSPSRSELPTSPSNSSHGKRNGADLKSSKTGHHCPGENAKVAYRIKQKRSAVVGAGNKAVPSRKLSFRKGKVIEVQPQNNIPRRLKFKPARQLTDAEREKVYTRKWISKRKEEDKTESNDAQIKSEKIVPRVQTVGGVKRRNFRKVLEGSKIDGSESGSQQVVLRHQNVLGKKDSRRLYNNVIEETASKLAELRKSKVKALVGAFETVISLDSPRPEAEASPM